MKRLFIEQLLDWKNKRGRKPLIIQGARQVGKTWIMKEFGANYFSNYVYINFESKSRLQQVFEDDFDIERILSIFEIESGEQIHTNTLIILDEIQEAKKGITSLKYFYEKKPELHVVAAGSYLGVSLQSNNSFPIGKVDLMQLNTMSFEEFLVSLNEEILLKNLKNKNWNIIEPFHEKLISYLRQYYFVGGMPEAVQKFITSKNYKEVREVQKNIISGYENDFAKHAPIEIVPKIKMVWQSILGQLSKENKKFIYGQIKKGARAKEFEGAINWLVNSGLLIKSHNVSSPKIPLNTYKDYDAFKLFFVDIGLLNAMAKLSEKILLNKNQILTEFKGAMTEQFVCQELTLKYELYYWTAERATAEIDFIIQKDQEVLPIEVKAEENLKAKSLKVYVEKYNPEKVVRTSMSFYRNEGWLENIPLYAILTI